VEEKKNAIALIRDHKGDIHLSEVIHPSIYPSIAIPTIPTKQPHRHHYRHRHNHHRYQLANNNDRSTYPD
jgi:hypothetical protein